MKNDELLEKLSHHKKFLFIVPNLIYATVLLYYYNNNFDSLSEVLFSEIIILFLFFFLITCLLQLLLKKALKDNQKVFMIISFICGFYFFNPNLVSFLLFIVFLLLIIIDFKKFIKFKLDTIVCLLSFIIIILFSYNFIVCSSHVIDITLRSKTYSNKKSFHVDEKTESPNIYWIHCDGMMGISAMKKYFNYQDIKLTDYLERNNYYLNKDATLIADHRTQRALVALFNPYYYDNFFKDYLFELEDRYLGKDSNIPFIVNFYELEDKRIHNELMMALEIKDYTTIAISEFDPYTSLDTDYFYDYYYFDDDVRFIDKYNSEFRLLKNNSTFKKMSYIRLVHAKPLLNETIFYDVMKGVNYLSYDVIDYNSFDTSNYTYIDKAMSNSNYWATKAILKGLDDVKQISKNKFVFVNFKANHDPFTFDYFGNVIDSKYQYNPISYLGNYTYSSYLLIDILEFIKNYDKNAIIIVQGDHGLHTLSDDQMRGYFGENMSLKEIQEVRNSVISAYYIPEKYQNGDEKYLDNPLNVSRYLVNNYIGNNYEYIE